MVDEFSEIMNHLSENARFALQKADYFSKRYNQGYMGTEHLLMGIMAQDTCTGAKILASEGVDLDQIERAQGKVAVDVPAAPMAMMSLSEATVLTLRMSLNFVKENGLDIVGTEHIVYSLLRQPNSRASVLLNQLDVDLDKVANEIEELIEKQADEASEDLKGLVFVVTGSLEHFSNRNELKALIESKGGKVTGSVSKSTDYLINNDIASGSSKNRTAKELGVPIITENEFIERFG